MNFYIIIPLPTLHSKFTSSFFPNHQWKKKQQQIIGGTDRPILSGGLGSKNIGVKKALVFYMGRPSKGMKTEWIMNEYRLLDSTIKSSRFKASMRLDDWVLCQVRQKGSVTKNAYEDLDNNNSNNKDIIWHLPRLEEACRPYTAYKNDMIAECLNNDCTLLASILAGQPLPRIQTTSSSASNQGSNTDNSYTSDRSHQLSSSPSFNNYCSFKRNTNEEADFLQSNKKICIGNIGDKNQSEYSFYNSNMFDLLNGCPEFDELASTITNIC